MKTFFLLISFFSINAFAQPVNINTADAETISSSLKGIGLIKAKEIIKYREEKGLFKTHKELTKVKGIGSKTVEKNIDDILFSKTKLKAKKARKEEQS